jgi:transcriptional regulator with XRE-family HTH domain
MTRQRLDQTKQSLKRKGWSHRTAARELGVSFEHLNRVLNGHRESRRLLTQITKLPHRPTTTPA